MHPVNRLPGIMPDNWFSSMLSLIKLERLPNSGGIEPTNWFLERLKCAFSPIQSPRQSSGSESTLKTLLAERQADVCEVVPPKASKLLGYAPGQFVADNVQKSQIGEVAQLQRYVPGQLVLLEM